jgi:hypothetical protein
MKSYNESLFINVRQYLTNSIDINNDRGATVQSAAYAFVVNGLYTPGGQIIDSQLKIDEQHVGQLGFDSSHFLPQ